MRVLLVHRSYPGQFRYLAAALAQQPGCEVVFLNLQEDGIDSLGIRKVRYFPQRSAQDPTHIYVHNLENAVLFGQAAYRAADKLKRAGWIPDVIMGHSGWGPTLYLKDVFPNSKLICYYEWFYRSHGSSHGFNPAVPVTADHEAQIRTKNAAILLDLFACDYGQCPTRWQYSQFPPEYSSKISVLHDGVDTCIFMPCPSQELVLPRLGLDLRGVKELVTYVATGMEPLRGFPQFMEAVAIIQERRPDCHIVVVGEDRVEYCNPLPSGQTYRQQALEKNHYDLNRLHFTGRLSLSEYRQVLWASCAHIYLTYPFILSWSILEAMACGCVVIGSDTPPVTEFIQDGINGLLIDFFAPMQIADRVDAVFDCPKSWQTVRRRARESILSQYDVKYTVSQQLAMLYSFADR